MYIQPKVSLKKVTIGKVNMIIPTDEARDLKRTYPDAKISKYTSKIKEKNKSGPCVSIPVQEYLSGVCNA